MLYLNFALNYEKLADQMMDSIQEHWRSPFDPPVVIFSDGTLEQWFKLRWVEKTGVIANFKSQFLNTFLFDILKSSENEKPLTRGMLRGAIISWIKGQQLDGNDVWREVADYLKGFASEELTATDARAYDQRVFDFADKMAGLFLEYENSRPDSFMPGKDRVWLDGILGAWKENDMKPFFHDRDGRETWQMALYDLLFHEHDGESSLLKQAFAQINDGVDYVTLPQLYDRRRRLPKDKIFKYKSKAPVYVFWHTGMGQTYRVILQKFSETHDVYVFVQNPCMEFWEDVDCQSKSRKWDKRGGSSSEPSRLFLNIDPTFNEIFEENENSLLQKWGRFGRDNIKLWCLASEYEFQFAEENEDFPVTNKLQAVQALVAHRKNGFDPVPELVENDESVTLVAAPSMIREVEVLHSRICKLLQAGSKVKDILVVAPSIDQYRTAIHQVFGQAVTKANELDRAQRELDCVPNGEGHREDVALHIPYSIMDGIPKESLIANILNHLFRIIRERTLTRKAFFEIVHNPLVQIVRGIKPEEVDAWTTWIGNMHVYRNRDGAQDIEARDDWNDAIKRLLLAKMSNVRIQFGDECITPYSDIETSNQASLCKFVDCIYDLDELANSGKKEGLTLDEIRSQLKVAINRWIALPSIPGNMKSESYIYQSVMDSFELFAMIDAASVEQNPVISWTLIERTLCDAAQSMKYTLGTIFINGITFMNLSADRVVPVKNLFVLGMGSKAFPGAEAADSLDLRNTRHWLGDPSTLGKNKYAFLCQLMCASDCVSLSYINKDLKKDETLYPSVVVNDLVEFINQMNENDRESKEGVWKLSAEDISLDEQRSWSELFTGRELRNRRVYDLMMSGKANDHVEGQESVTASVLVNDKVRPALPERVSLFYIRKFLANPIELRAQMVLCDEENEEFAEDVEFEPIELNSLQKAKYLKQFMVCALGHSEFMEQLDEVWSAYQAHIDGLKDESLKLLYSVFNAFWNALKENGIVPDGVYGECYQRELISIGLQLLVALKNGDDKTKIRIDYRKLILASNFDVEMTEETVHQNWVLQCKNCVWHTDDLSYIVEIKLHNISDRCSAFVNLYVHALALVAKAYENNKIDAKKINDITLCVIFYNSGKAQLKTKRVELTAKDAIDILNRVYVLAFAEQKCEAAPIELVEDKKLEEMHITSYEKLLNGLQNDVWKYYNQSKQFDFSKDLGFPSSQDEFLKAWLEVKARQLELMKPLNPKWCKDNMNETTEE